MTDEEIQKLAARIEKQRIDVDTKFGHFIELAKQAIRLRPKMSAEQQDKLDDFLRSVTADILNKDAPKKIDS